MASTSQNQNQSSTSEKDKDSRWYFTAEQLNNSPSRRSGIPSDKELLSRQQAANLIQCMGQQLHVSQLCINTAIVYMHRFYAFHSFSQFHRNAIAQASLFLAAKVEEQPRKLEHVIKEAQKCLHLPEPSKEHYTDLAQNLVFNENVLLQTLGFDVAIDHPHTHVVKTCHLVKASKDLAQTSYFMASNSLHLTTMCLQYRPTVVACFCIHLACKWSRWEIPQSTERKHWFQYVDKSVTMDLLEKLTEEFLHIFDLCPSRLKSKMKSMSSSAQEEMQKAMGLPAGPSGAGTITIPDGIGGQTSSTTHNRHHHAHHSSSSQQGHFDHHSAKIPTQSSSSSTHKQQQQPQVHPIPSNSNINRQRNDRSLPPSNSYVPTMNSHTSQSNSSSNSSNSNKIVAPNIHGNSSNNAGRTTSSSASSQKIPTHNNESSVQHSRDRNRTSSMSSSSNSQNLHNHKSSDQRHLQKETIIKNEFNKMPMPPSQDINKSTNIAIKQENPMFPTNRPESMKNISKPPIPPQYNSATSNHMNNRLDQQQHINQKIPSNESFKLVDDTNRLMEPLQMNSPPKQNKPSSIFSPDWKDTSFSNNTQSIQNTNNLRNNSNNINNNNPNNNILNREIKQEDTSPTNSKKQQNYPYDRRPETPKKDKKSDIQKMISGGSSSSSSDKRINNSGNSASLSNKKMPDNFGMINSFEPIQMNKNPQSSSTSSKRPFSEVSIKQEDSNEYKDFKMRKIDFDMMSGITSPSNDVNNKYLGISTNSNNSSNSYDNMIFGGDSKSNKSNYSGSTVNGIETNPALVSNLLKEICVESKFNQSSIIPSQQQQHQQQQQQHHQQMQQNLSKLQSNVPAVSLMPTISPKLEPQMDMLSNLDELAPMSNLLSIKQEPNNDDYQRSKSEKKKKKDKHKHKEKEKSKDKEERKKHKKDKDRHKDRERTDISTNKSPISESSMDHTPVTDQTRIKITIPKEKFSLPNNEMNPGSGFKIKIPKERLKSDLSTTNSYYTSGEHNSQSHNSQPMQNPPTNSLKIKISKDMIENYSSSSSHHNNDGPSIHHSAKKKDREKDRERSSKSSKIDLAKQNFNGNGNNNPGGNGNGGGSSIGRGSTSNPNQKNLSYLNHTTQYNTQQQQQQQQHQQPNQLQHPPQHSSYQQYQQNLNSSNTTYNRLTEQNKHTMSNNNFYYANRIPNNNPSSK